MRVHSFLLCLSAFLITPAMAAPTDEQEPLGWLQRMSQSARGLNYSGVFVFQLRERSGTSRVTHMVDASGAMEKLEALDGAPREVVRIKDEVRNYLPQEKLVVLDRAASMRFPGRFLMNLSGIAEHYDLRMGNVSRVAGREAQKIVLMPSDAFRYGYQIWADIETGIALKARVMNERGEVLEQIAFTEIDLGLAFDRDRVKTSFPKTDTWRVQNVRGGEVRVEDVPWVFNNVPAGYRQISSQHRVLRRDSPAAYHAVFSDGLATMSVFVEKIDTNGGATPAPTSQGAMGIYKRMLADHQITVVGEVPMAALARLAQGVEPRRP